jgi:hypothetical protein
MRKVLLSGPSVGRKLWSRTIENGHRSETVGKLAFELQATVEISLRTTAHWIEAKGTQAPGDHVTHAYQKASGVAFDLGQEVLRS